MEATKTNKKPKTRSWNIFFQLTKRHFLVFFKSKMTVLYTLLVPIIIFAIYILFLKDLELSTIKSALIDYGISIESGSELESSLSGIVDAWMMSGILGVSAITISIQTNYIFVRDKDQGINRDFLSSPINGNILIASYFVFVFVVTLLISIVFLLIAFLYLFCQGEFVYDFVDFLSILGTCIISTASATLCTIFICSFIKKESSLTSIIAILSTAIGFLIGAYMPISLLPTPVQYFCAFLPATHCCGIYRYVFLATPYENLATLVSTMEGGQDIINAVESSFSLNLNFFGYEITPGYMTLVVVIYMVIFLVLDIFAGRNLTKTSDGALKKAKKKKEEAAAK